MGVTPRDRTTRPNSIACPICASKRVERTVTMEADYRCPDCGGLFDADGRVIADPRCGRLDEHGRERPEG